MPDSADICLRTTRSTIVRQANVSSARRPSSAIPRLTDTKMCRDDDDDDDDNPRVASNPQTMPVYLRIKPRLTKSKRVKKVNDDSYVILDSTTLATKFSSLETTGNSSNKTKFPDSTSRKFNFTKIFGPETTQLEFFDNAIKHRIVEFIDGQSFTFMSYGTTDTGKSYTFHGNDKSPGIVPRTIEFVFSEINCTLSPWYKPENFGDVACLNEAERCREIEIRDGLLISRSMEKSVCEEAYGLLENSSTKDEHRETSNSGDAMYSVWLSFMEIYNENIYDLLADDDSRTNKLAPLRLVKDKHGRVFVQGLRMICATTGLEAYRLLTAGQSKLTAGSTSLNPQSSRSHSIFTIKLLKYIGERASHEVELSTMTFCDLAGTGRTRKTAGVGNELKEAKNINTSLLVLGRCLKSTSDGQTSKQNVEIVGPFRESKLTRLFERVLSGKENLSMIINVDTSPDVHVETLNVLNFSAIAKKIFVETGKRSCATEPIKDSPKSIVGFVKSARSASIGRVENLDVSETTDKHECRTLKERNVALNREIEILRETALNRESEIREEMINLYGGADKDLEANWKERTSDVEREQDDFLKWSVKEIEKFYKDRIDSLTNRKRRRTSGGDHKDDGKALFEQLESENVAMTEKILTLRETVKKFKDEQEIFIADKNKCVFELGLVKEKLRQLQNLINNERGENIFIIDDNDVIADFKRLMDEKNEKLNNLRNEICERATTNNVDASKRSTLESFTIEELTEEISKRNEKQLAKTKTLESNESVNEKFCSSSFDEEIVGSPISREKYDRQNSSHETMDKAFRSNDDSAQNDSGIVVATDVTSSSIDSTSLQNHGTTEEKECQTIVDDDDEDDDDDDGSKTTRREQVDQLKVDYTKLTNELYRETIRVSEFSQKLEYVQYALGELKQVTKMNERKIIHYEEQLSAREKDLSQLERTKTDMECKLTEITRQLKSTSLDYEKKIDELSDELKIREETDKQKTKILEDIEEKSNSLENQLSIAQIQLDRTTIKCLTEHVPRIEKLEKELNDKTRIVCELDEKLSNRERDAERVTELNDRVTDFAKNFEDRENERDELRRQLLERLETQSTLENKIKKLTSRVHDRENEISSLKMDLGNIAKINTENSERAQELSKQMSIALGRLASAKGEMVRSEDERRKLERTSGREIGNLIARLADFEKNAAVLARMRDNEHSRTDELERVKLLLHEKERHMCLFKKNRDKTIRRYEALIRKLQADVEKQCKRESSKLRMLYPKRAISKDSLRSLTESLRWKSTLVESLERKKLFPTATLERKCNQYRCSCRCADHRRYHGYPTCSRCSTIIKRSSSQALVTSSTSFEGSRSSESKIFPIRDDDEDDCVEHEIIETESCTELNLGIVESLDNRGRESLSQAAATFSIPSTSDESRTDFRNAPGWMEIRRTNGRTHFRLGKADSDVGGEDKPSL